MPEIIPASPSGPGNEKIGGVPTFYYFDFKSRGRGQVIRSFFDDAGIAFKDVRFPLTGNEYKEFKAGQLAQWNPQTTIPLVELNGTIYTQSYAMLRHFARVLDGKYEGKTEDEKYFADIICDVVIDWRTKFLANYFGEDASTKYPAYCKDQRPVYLKGTETQLHQSPLSQRGPYILGRDVSYADFVLYQILHDEELTQNERAGLKEYPRLTQLVDAMESRPALSAFLKSNRYRG